VDKAQKNNAQIVHELDKRIRIRCPYFLKKGFDPGYMEAILANVEGVENVRINRLAASAIVNYDGKAQTRLKILELCKAAPEEAFLPEERFTYRVNPFTLLFLGAACLFIKFFPRPVKYLITFATTLPTILRGVVVLFTKGLKVEVLDSAVLIFCLMRKDFFTANAVVFLLTLGDYLEDLSEDKSTALLKSLVKSGSEEAWVEIDGQEVSVPIAQIKPGDIVVCGAGETVPVDGIVVSGDALIDQSSITGESRPVHVEKGKKILAGSIVIEGRIRIETLRSGSDTTMARIKRYLEQSVRTKSLSQKKSEEIADSLVPVTLGLGLGIFVVTGDPNRAASVLTVDYSCAIKLMNPVATKAYMYNAAKNGVLIKGATALDNLAAVDTMIFDKTGTLTEGKLEVVDLIPALGISKSELLSLAASAEQHYAHPVALAVVNAAKKQSIPFTAMSQVDFIVAHGVSAYMGDKRILVGSRHFIEEDEGISFSENWNVERLYKQGSTLLFVARDQSPAGIIILKDRIRPEARRVLKTLKKMGISKIVVLTGDHKNAALALKKALPEIDEILWELKPDEKAKKIEMFNKKGFQTAFVGDGVNDAPALVTAKVGICMPSGSDLAKGAAQVILLQEDLTGLLIARKAAVNNMKTLRKGFYANFGLNSLFLLGAITGNLSPLASAVLHNMTTVGTISYCFISGVAMSGEVFENE